MPWQMGKLSKAELADFLEGAHALRASRVDPSAVQTARPSSDAGAGRRSLPFVVHGPRED